MAKPYSNQPGSSMHIHQSILDIKTGENLFTNDDDSRSESFYNYIGELQKYIISGKIFACPNVNSYRRITVDNDAPVNLQWGKDNHTVGIREPMSDPKERRIENRLSG